MNDRHLPQEVAAYLVELDRLLATLPDSERQAIVVDVAEHIRAELDDGLPPGQILVNLGPAADVAAAAFEAPVERAPVEPAWWTPTRIAQLVAMALFVAAGLLIAFVPVGTSVTETGRPALVAGEETSGTTVVTDVDSYYLAEDVGWYGVVALAVMPALLAGWPMLLRGLGHRIATIAVAVIAFFLAGLALASIGMFWLPGVLTLVLAAALLPVKPRPRRAAPAQPTASVSPRS